MPITKEVGLIGKKDELFYINIRQQEVIEEWILFSSVLVSIIPVAMFPKSQNFLKFQSKPCAVTYSRMSQINGHTHYKYFAIKLYAFFLE